MWRITGLVIQIIHFLTRDYLNISDMVTSFPSQFVTLSYKLLDFTEYTFVKLNSAFLRVLLYLQGSLLSWQINGIYSRCMSDAFDFFDQRIYMIKEIRTRSA